MTADVLRCRLCRAPMQYLHGHAACLTSRCPLFGQNQAECCDGEQCADDWVPASDAASAGGAQDRRDPGSARAHLDEAHLD